MVILCFSDYQAPSLALCTIHQLRSRSVLYRSVVELGETLYTEKCAHALNTLLSCISGWLRETASHLKRTLTLKLMILTSHKYINTFKFSYKTIHNNIWIFISSEYRITSNWSRGLLLEQVTQTPQLVLDPASIRSFTEVKFDSKHENSYQGKIIERRVVLTRELQFDKKMHRPNKITRNTNWISHDVQKCHQQQMISKKLNISYTFITIHFKKFTVDSIPWVCKTGNMCFT